MIRVHILEIALRLEDVESPSWEELEVKIRETLMNALNLNSMDSVDVDFLKDESIDIEEVAR